MTKAQPLRNLRKTTIVVIAVFLGFLLHGIIAFCFKDEVIRDSAESELIVAQGEVCSHIVNGSPFGTDSVFDVDTRLYYYATVSRAAISEEDSLMHIWFNGLDTVLKAPCHLTGESCYTTVDPKLMKEGEWSVDFVAGRKLLATQQFKVIPSLR